VPTRIAARTTFAMCVPRPLEDKLEAGFLSQPPFASATALLILSATLTFLINCRCAHATLLRAVRGALGASPRRQERRQRGALRQRLPQHGQTRQCRVPAPSRRARRDAAGGLRMREGGCPCRRGAADLVRKKLLDCARRRPRVVHHAATRRGGAQPGTRHGTKRRFDTSRRADPLGWSMRQPHFGFRLALDADSCERCGMRKRKSNVGFVARVLLRAPSRIRGPAV
jgi:hypothetical protein